MKFHGTDSYVATEDLQMAVNAAVTLQRPLLIKGEPGTGKFQWEMTGRHLTLRADGDSVENMAFGGPVVYGHGEESPKDNLFHYQTKKANEVFAALDTDQAKRALVPPISATKFQLSCSDIITLRQTGTKRPALRC